MGEELVVIVTGVCGVVEMRLQKLNTNCKSFSSEVSKVLFSLYN